ncbi:early endosome antigen 1-like [Trachinotus anak]|uniref:early endosome antigen 1-like n=1 Tax=Trachinotus anak TaxID=443729 RepID=UPI0039F1A921
MANQIAKTTQSLTTAAEMRETTKMLMQPNANWEEYLTPAPLSIAIMGELVFISSCDDFSINENPPEKGYQYIKYPNSFRACLMQICNSGWHAFNEAHKNMDQIRIHTGTVPDYLKAAVNILFNASDEAVETLLPNQLENIREIADECVILASNVETKYADVINLIQELLEACVNAQHFYGEELEKVKMKLEETKLREQTAKNLNEQSKKAMEALSKEVEEAQDAFKQSMDSLPSGWEMIGMDFVEGLTSSVTGILNGLTAQMSGTSNTAGGSSPVQNNTNENVDKTTQMRVCSKSGEILSLAATLSQYVSEDGIDWKNLYDQKNKRPKTEWTQSQFRRISQEVEGMPKDKMCKKVLSLCTKSLTICQKLAKYTPDKKWDEKETKQLIKHIQELNDDALAFDSKSKGTLGSPALTPKSPMMFKAESNSSEKKSAGQRATENARFRIEQSREQLKQTRQSYEKCVENMEKNQRELNDILVEMQNCKIKEIDFETTIKMLVKGLDAMGRVKEQWEKMVRFFQMVSNIIKTSLSKTLHNFVKTSEDTKKLSYSSKHFTKDLLYNQAFQASNIASLVHMISGTYTEVSNKYLMDKVSSLGKLMAMDKEKPEFLQERQNLQESCQAAQKGILQLVIKNKQDFERKTDARMAKIEGELKAILPPAPPQETERIKEIVQSNFTKEDIDDYC